MTRAKRIFDLGFSCFALLITAPLFILVALAIKLDSQGPVLFRQTRVGRFGKLFAIYKFRTMQFDAKSNGKQITIGDDERVTRVGRWLRKYKVDELPQLLNVVKGDMSIVGPRPEVPHYVSSYTLEQQKVINLVPGMMDSR